MTMKQARKIHRETRTNVFEVRDREGNVLSRVRSSSISFRTWLRYEYKGTRFGSPKFVRILAGAVAS